VASKGMVVLQALAGVLEEPTSGQAAAAVPTIAPVPVPMRAESGVHIPGVEDSGTSRPEQASETVVAAPVRPEEQAAVTNPDAGQEAPGQQAAGQEPPAGDAAATKPAARRRPKKK